MVTDNLKSGGLASKVSLYACICCQLGLPSCFLKVPKASVLFGRGADTTRPGEYSSSLNLGNRKLVLNTLPLTNNHFKKDRRLSLLVVRLVRCGWTVEAYGQDVTV